MSWGVPPQAQYQQPPPRYGAPSTQHPPPQYGQATGYGQGHAQAPPPYSAPQTAPQTAPGGYSGQRPQYGQNQFAQQGPPPGVSPDLWNWFQSVDRDKSGKITAIELQQALHNGDWSPFNAETCRLMIGMFDRDRSGTIDVAEFAALWKYIQDWKACFDRFDTDRSGNISADELMNAFRSFGYNLSMNFIHICMRTYDRRQTGNINFDDFIQCCVMLKSLTEKFREKDAQQKGVVNIHYEEFLKMVLDNSVI